MIPFEKAYTQVLDNLISLGTEKVSIDKANGRILAENILADRDFPPFNRSTKDGIVINYSSVKKGIKILELKEVIAAGSPTKELLDENSAHEIMTGAVVPQSGDTVIMYEELKFQDGKVILPESITKGQNIHYQGSDLEKNEQIITSPKKITASEIGVLASVGKYEVEVKKLPKIAVISTGNELVDINEQPKPYQIRKSNTYSLKAALEDFNIKADIIHLKDDKNQIYKSLTGLLDKYDVLILSGGVSKGKYDYLPAAFDKCGVEKVFHRVLQRPGKPFWFGKHITKNTIVFSFPGNPVSTFTGYHVYFIPWLKKSFGLPLIENKVITGEDFVLHDKLTLFIPVRLVNNSGQLKAFRINQNGSGDLTSLTNIHGVIKLSPGATTCKKESLVTFISTNYFNL